ncbi:MAG: glucosaminidase domain-containing protein [Alphaproteobacteria bacterium]
MRTLNAHRPLSATDQAWLDELAVAYHLRPPVSIGRLLRHVDIVPPSLALAQAATESGWGTSRFASEGNALFGQVSTAEGGGLVPRASSNSSKTISVKTFASPLDAVAAYVRNLNTNLRNVIAIGTC